MPKRPAGLIAAEVAATPVAPVLGEASFLGRREPAPAPALAPEPQPDPDPLPPEAVAPAPVAPRRLAPLPALQRGDVDLDRLVRTSIALSGHEQLWLKETAERRGSVGVRRATKDFVARGILRAVHELEPDLDLHGITLDDEDEFVDRVKQALTALR